MDWRRVIWLLVFWNLEDFVSRSEGESRIVVEIYILFFDKSNRFILFIFYSFLSFFLGMFTLTHLYFIPC